MDTPIVIVEGSQSELEQTSQVEASEAIADASVEIAQIQADRDVAIAEINAETTEAVVEASQPAPALEERVSECQRNIEAIRSELSEQRVMLQSILERLSPLAQSPENRLVSENVEAMPVNREVQEEPPQKKRRFRWI